LAHYFTKRPQNSLTVCLDTAHEFCGRFLRIALKYYEGNEDLLLSETIPVKAEIMAIVVIPKKRRKTKGFASFSVFMTLS
jgi:S-methylmethionine-dependent homocysteine/selenocysteine methylase